jgi:hypothetical protein
MIEPQIGDRRTTSTKWAPWWVYVAIIIGANYLRKALLGEGDGPAVRVAVALALSAALFVIITIVYRVAQPVRRR